MKILLSWSGSQSQKAAEVFRNWIPNVLQYVDAFISSNDIDKGTRWGENLFETIKETSFGIVFLDQSNLEAPWILFESGALSNAIDKGRVAPILFNLKQTDVKGPLAQFQLTVFLKTEIKKLIVSINNFAGAEGLDPHVIDRVFEKWWDDLEKEIEEIDFSKSEESNRIEIGKDNTISPVIEEIDVNIRSIKGMISDPSQILPVDYLLYAVKNIERNIERSSILSQNHPVWMDIENFLERIYSGIGEDDERSKLELFEAIDGIRGGVNYIRSRLYDSTRARRGRPTGLRSSVTRSD